MFMRADIRQHLPAALALFALGQIEPHLLAEQADGTCPGPILLEDPGIANKTYQIKILLHGRIMYPIRLL